MPKNSTSFTERFRFFAIGFFVNYYNSVDEAERLFASGPLFRDSFVGRDDWRACVNAYFHLIEKNSRQRAADQTTLNQAFGDLAREASEIMKNK